jgi:hypothetical protein
MSPLQRLLSPAAYELADGQQYTHLSLTADHVELSNSKVKMPTPQLPPSSRLPAPLIAPSIWALQGRDAGCCGVSCRSADGPLKVSALLENPQGRGGVVGESP